MQFRKDINGLRAVAVIAVVLFHFNEQWIPGGFAGVDVFFVISGFLMTAIIFKGLENNSFSILKFYIARANRIVPALAFLCIVLLTFGWFYLPPSDYAQLGHHAAGSVSFISNILYWRESGYFATASHENWLLHTWSLSAEWQFYVLYPLIIILLKKFLQLKYIKVLIFVGTLLCFLFCIVATYKWPNPSYYLLPTRAWEMMLGGVAYLYPLRIKNQAKKYLESAGICLIIFSYFMISKDSPWPGYLALFPVLGAYILIQTNRNGSFITGNILFQKLGKWSYSIYLWHWPIVVGINYFAFDDSFIYAGIFFSIVLGFLSNKYIESIRFKKEFGSFKEYLKCSHIYIIFLVCIVGISTFITNGFQWHYSAQIVIVSNEAENRNPYKCMIENKFPCVIGNKNNIMAIIVGDSHADSVTTSLASIFDLENEGVISLTKAACPFVLNMKSINNSDECLLENARRLKYLTNNHHTTPIYWVARTGVYIYGQSNPDLVNPSKGTKPSIYFSKKFETANEELLNELEWHLNRTIESVKLNRQIYMVLPTPEMRIDVPKKMSRGMLLGLEDIDIKIPLSAYYERNKTIRNLIDRVTRNNEIESIDPIPYLCDTLMCRGQLSGRPLFFDDNHLSEHGNKLIKPMFMDTIK